MTLIRYLLVHHTVRVVAALGLLTLVYLVFDLGGPGRLLAVDLGWGAVLGAALLHVPLIVVQLLPAAMLVGGAMSVASLARRGELEAMAAAGMTPRQMAVPWLIISLGGLTLCVSLNEVAVPPAETRADQLYQHRRASALTGALAGRRWYGNAGAGWMARLGPPGAGLRPLWALHLDNNHQLVESIKGSLVAGSDVVRHAQRVEFTDNGMTVTQVAQLRLAALGPISRASRADRRRPEALGSMALRQRISQGGSLGRSSRSDRMVLHTRLAYPWLNLVVALLAWAPMGSVRRPTPTRRLGRAVGWIVALWLLMASGWMLGTTGLVAPWAAAWGSVTAAALLALLGVRASAPRVRDLEAPTRLC